MSFLTLVVVGYIATFSFPDHASLIYVMNLLDRFRLWNAWYAECWSQTNPIPKLTKSPRGCYRKLVDVAQEAGVATLKEDIIVYHRLPTRKPEAKAVVAKIVMSHET